MSEIPDAVVEVVHSAPTPRNNDQIYLLIGALLCFVTGIVLAIIRGCSDATVGLAIGGGVGVVGAMGGISRGSGTPSGESLK